MAAAMTLLRAFRTNEFKSGAKLKRFVSTLSTSLNDELLMGAKVKVIFRLE